MRIALCNAIYATPTHPRIVGGAEIFVRQFAEALTEQGDEVIAIRFSPSGVHETETINGVTVHFVPVRNFFPPFEDKRHALLRTAWHAIDDRAAAHPLVTRILSDFRPDVLHSNTLNGVTTGVWSAARHLGIPILHTLHDYYLICPRCSRYNKGHSCEATCRSCGLLTPVRRRRAALVDGVVGVSRRTLELHTEHGVFANARLKSVISNVANPAIAPSPQPPRQGPLTIGYLGRFSEEKGVRLLAQAVGLLAPGMVRLRLAGNVGDEERAHICSLAPDVDIEFVGFVNPNAFYPTVEVVVVPSLWEEPSPLALIDALAAGRPVIATPYGGLPEVVDDGVTGWIAVPDAQGLAGAIQALLDDPGRIDQAHHALVQNFRRRTLTDIIDDYRSLYLSLLKYRNGG
jgi:glycosyltransferase involved in cell wall biosynthesis